MRRAITIGVAVGLAVCGVALAQVSLRTQLPGRYLTPAKLTEMMNDPSRERQAQFYLMGAYDLAQDSHQSCAALGTTTPTLLEKIVGDYLRAHPEAASARTAASVAAQAFSGYWPCGTN